jgi:MFS family permease
MGETIRARYRGRAVGTVQAGWAVGWGLSVVLFTVLFFHLPGAIAWRVMFWIGILPALLIVYIRSKVHEPEIYRAIKETSKAGFLQIFSAAQWRTTLLAAIVALGAQGGYHAVTTWLPLYLSSTRGLTALNTGGYLSVVIAGAFLGYLAAAHLTDAIGRKRTLILFAACSFVAVICYAGFPISNHLMLGLGFPLGFFPSGSFSPLGAYFSELFPTPIRASASGFAYNLGRGAGASFPTLVGYLSGRTSLGTAISLFGSGAYLIMILGVLFLPETRGLSLNQMGREDEWVFKESA